jgi:hypothetical protein
MLAFGALIHPRKRGNEVIFQSIAEFSYSKTGTGDIPFGFKHFYQSSTNDCSLYRDEATNIAAPQ